MAAFGDNTPLLHALSDDRNGASRPVMQRAR